MKSEFENTNLEDPNGIIALARALDPSYDPEKDENYMGREMLAYFWKKMDDEKTEVSRLIEKKYKEVRIPLRAVETTERTVNHAENTLINRELKHHIARKNILSTFQNSIALHGVGGPFGFCTESGEEIGVKRLKANQTTTLTVEEQTKMEKKLSQYRR